MSGFRRFGEGDSKDNGKGDSKKICPKCMLLGTFDVIWDDLRTFWSDLLILLLIYILYDVFSILKPSRSKLCKE